MKKLFVLNLTMILIALTNLCYSFDVGTFGRLENRVNLINVFGGNIYLASVACDTYESEMNISYSSDYWKLEISSNITLNSIRMGSLDPKYAGLCEKSVIFDDGGYQIRNFNIILNIFFNWCYQEYPTYDNCNCTIGNPMSYLDVLMHEMGHAVGLLDIYQVCLDSDWSSCQYDIDEIPTMTSLSPDCEQYNIYS